MAKILVWSTNPLAYATTVDGSSNTLEITFNDVVTPLVVEVNPYMTDVIRHESRLVDEINDLFILNGLPIECKLGVVASGNQKQAYVVFVHEDTDTFSYNGTFKTVIDL